MSISQTWSFGLFGGRIQVQLCFYFLDLGRLAGIRSELAVGLYLLLLTSYQNQVKFTADCDFVNELFFIDLIALGSHLSIVFQICDGLTSFLFLLLLLVFEFYLLDLLGFLSKLIGVDYLLFESLPQLMMTRPLSVLILMLFHLDQLIDMLYAGLYFYIQAASRVDVVPNPSDLCLGLYRILSVLAKRYRLLGLDLDFASRVLFLGEADLSFLGEPQDLFMVLFLLLSLHLDFLEQVLWLKQVIRFFLLVFILVLDLDEVLDLLPDLPRFMSTTPQDLDFDFGTQVPENVGPSAPTYPYNLRCVLRLEDEVKSLSFDGYLDFLQSFDLGQANMDTYEYDDFKLDFILFMN